jgi:hypothetical protein
MHDRIILAPRFTVAMVLWARMNDSRYSSELIVGVRGLESGCLVITERGRGNGGGIEHSNTKR